MKSAAEKNEIAGPALQKVPHSPVSKGVSADSAAPLTVEFDSNPADHKKDGLELTATMNLAPQPVAIRFEQAPSLATTPATDHAAQIERVAHLVTQEVVMVRLSGANALAVSLKLDPHTELFLQLTNHNGQMQASLRCERGSIAGLDNHWADLQESLARQNVHLLPLEVKASTGASAFNASSQNPQRRDRELPQDAPISIPVKTISTTAKIKTKNSSRQGWESWA